MEYKWPLSIPQFSLLDKIKLVTNLLTDDRWTHGKTVNEFEKKMATYVGSRYAVFTSSGSTANTLLAMMLKDKLSNGRKVVVFPSTTWITSVSPFIREGFTPEFIDVNMEDFSINLDLLEGYLKTHSHNVACIFITSLIGFTPNINALISISHKYNVRIMMDNCENTLGKYGSKNVSGFFTSTTSTYFGHQLQSIEGGFVFTNDDDEYDYLLMARNHGMLRHLPVERREKYRNYDVDKLFDFAILGNNFRNTNINAFLGMCDLKRADKYFEKRRYLYDVFYCILSEHLILPTDNGLSLHAPFCLPIIPKYAKDAKLNFVKLKKLCDSLSIESRPIISGNLLRQSCLKSHYYELYHNSEYLHQNGFYVGLHGSTTERQVKDLANKILKIVRE